MFETYFFDRHMLNQYHVFRVMKAMAATSFTVTRLAQVTGLSYAQTYAAFQAIMQDLRELGVLPEESINEADFTRRAADLTVDQYRLYLLNQCPGFRLFTYLFTTADPDIHMYFQLKGYNITTMRRRVAAYKRYLKGCHVTMNPSTWALEGPESQIRLAMQTFFQLAYRGNGWPFSPAIDHAVHAHLLNLDDQARADWFIATQPTMQDRLALACQLIRIRHGHLLPPNAKFELMLAAQDRPLPPLFADMALGAVDARTETLWYCFMQLHVLSFEPTPTPATNWLVSQFGALDAAPVAFVKGLLQWLDDHEVAASGQPATDIGMVANLYRIAYSFAIMGTNFSRRIDFYDADLLGANYGTLPAAIAAYFDGLPETGELGRFRLLAPLMGTRLFLTTARAYPALNADHRLKVATLVDPGTFVIRDLLQFLSGIRFVQLLPAGELADADLIITTLADPALKNTNLPKQMPVVHWQTAAADNDYFRLYTFLRERCDAHNQALAAE